MADNAPSSWSNIGDAAFKVGKAIFDTSWLTPIQNLRYLYERLMHLPAGGTQQNYGHSHGELSTGSTPPDGVTIRRSIFNQAFRNSTYEYITFSLAATTWTELIRFRSWCGPFRNLALELRYKVSGDAVKFRLERYDWVDSANASTMTQGLQEQIADKNSTSAVWHTLDGQQWDGLAYSGSDTKLLSLDGPTSMTDFDELCAPAEFRLYAYGSAALDMDIYNVHLFEVLSTEESSGVLS